MLSLSEILETIKANGDQIAEFGVKKIGVFGSHVRGDASPDSDIDILVELDPKTFDNYMELKFYLEELFDKKVDLVLHDSLKPRLRPHIEKEVIYAA